MYAVLRAAPRSASSADLGCEALSAYFDEEIRRYNPAVPDRTFVEELTAMQHGNGNGLKDEEKLTRV